MKSKYLCVGVMIFSLASSVAWAECVYCDDCWACDEEGAPDPVFVQENRRDPAGLLLARERRSQILRHDQADPAVSESDAGKQTLASRLD